MSAFYSDLVNKERWGFVIYRTLYILHFPNEMLKEKVPVL
jgi:hypothetical protein